MKDLLTRFCITIIFVLGSAAFAAGRAEPMPESLLVGALKGPTGLTVVKMLEDAPRLKGADIRYFILSSPDLVISRLLAGELDFANLPTNAAAKLYNGGVPIRLAAVNTWGVLYVLTRDPEIAGWEDLCGKTLSLFGRGATPDVVIRYLLERNGLAAGEDVTLDFSAGQVELAQLMLAGRRDTVLLPEPFVTQVLRAAADVRIALDVQEEWRSASGGETPLAMGCLVVRSETAEEAPELVAGYLHEYQRSIEWLNANPEKAAGLVGKHDLGIEAETAIEAIPRSNSRFVSAASSRDSVEAYLSVLLDYAPESVGGKLPDDGFYLK